MSITATAALVGAGVSAYSAYNQSKNDKKQQKRQENIDEYNKQVNQRTFNQQRIENSPWYQVAQMKRAGLNPYTYSGDISQGQTEGGNQLSATPSYAPTGSVGVGAGSAISGVLEAMRGFELQSDEQEIQRHSQELEERKQNIQWFQFQSNQLDELHKDDVIDDDTYQKLKNYYDSLASVDLYGHINPDDNPTLLNEKGFGLERFLSGSYTRTGRKISNEAKEIEKQKIWEERQAQKMANDLVRYGGEDLPSYMQAKIIQMAESGNPAVVSSLLDGLGCSASEIRDFQHTLADLIKANAVLDNQQKETDLYHTYETMAIEAETAISDLVSQIVSRGFKLKNLTRIEGNYNDNREYHKDNNSSNTYNVDKSKNYDNKRSYDQRGDKYQKFNKGAFGGTQGFRRRKR